MENKRKHITLYRKQHLIGFIYADKTEISFQHGLKALRVTPTDKLSHNITLFIKNYKVISNKELKAYL